MWYLLCLDCVWVMWIYLIYYFEKISFFFVETQRYTFLIWTNELNFFKKYLEVNKKCIPLQSL